MTDFASLAKFMRTAIASAWARVRQPKIGFKAFRMLCVIDKFAREELPSASPARSSQPI
jgi:hypothetical protein